MTEEAELMGLLSSLWYLRDSRSLGLLPDSMSLGHWDHNLYSGPTRLPTPVSYRHLDS